MKKTRKKKNKIQSIETLLNPNKKNQRVETPCSQKEPGL